MIRYPQCPSCHSGQIKRYGTASQCRMCGHVCPNHKLIHAPDALPSKKPGSGVIAGKITIGRGMRWGAGLV